MYYSKIITLGAALLLNEASSSCDPVQELVGQCPTMLGTVVKRNNIDFNNNGKMQITISAKGDGGINYVISQSGENPEWAEYHEWKANYLESDLENLALTIPGGDDTGLLRKYLGYVSELAKMTKS